MFTNRPFSNTPGRLLISRSKPTGSAMPPANFTSSTRLPWSVTTGPALRTAIRSWASPAISSNWPCTCRQAPGITSTGSRKPRFKRSTNLVASTTTTKRSALRATSFSCT